MFRWMTIDMFECVFVIDHTFIIVNIYRLVFLLCKTEVLIVLKGSTININNEYTIYPLLKTNPYVIYQCPFNVPSLSPNCPLTVHSLCLQ